MKRSPAVVAFFIYTSIGVANLFVALHSVLIPSKESWFLAPLSLACAFLMCWLGVSGPYKTRKKKGEKMKRDPEAFWQIVATAFVCTIVLIIFIITMLEWIGGR